MSGWSVSVYPAEEQNCAMKVPEVEMSVWLEASVMLLPVNIMLSNNRVADASSVKSV